MEKKEIRQLLIEVAKYVESSDCADRNYLLMFIKKMYMLLGCRTGGHGTDFNRVQAEQEFNEWLELMAWCEMWSMIAYQDLTRKNNQILANFTKLREDIRQGIYLVKNDGKNDQKK